MRTGHYHWINILVFVLFLSRFTIIHSARKFSVAAAHHSHHRYYYSSYTCSTSITATPTLITAGIRNIMMTSTASSAPYTVSTSFPKLHFDNRHLTSLPIDPISSPGVREVSNAIFSRVSPTPVLRPRLIAASSAALALLEEDEQFDPHNEEALATHLSGNLPIPGADPIAHCYAGYQFGNFAGQLGDGAAILLGEVLNGRGERWELQLKGAGLTPFSRTADGRKVLRSSVREFLCSEAMHFLGVPTTRAAAVVTSDSTVVRDPFYDGTQLDEKCCVVARIAPTFFRFGSLEVFLGGERTGGRDGPSARNERLKRELVDYVIASYYPELNPVEGGFFLNESEEVKYELLFREVLRRTAELVAQWQAAGFVHGVLNTDNMSLMGVTLDYGPFAFMEQYDPDFTPNGSDGSARYAYNRQPAIGKVNLKKLAEALHPLLSEKKAAAVLATYDQVYEAKYLELMSQKIGLPAALTKEMSERLFDTMAATAADFTDTFVALTEFMEELATAASAASAGAEMSSRAEAAVAALRGKLVSRCASPSERVDAIKRSLRISRLSLGLMPQQVEMVWKLLQSRDLAVQSQVADMFGGVPIEVVREEVGNEKRKLDRIKQGTLDVRQLEATRPEDKAAADGVMWDAWIAGYAEQVSRLSVEELRAAAAGMRRVNPTFVLRNWIAHQSIAAAEGDDFSKVRRVLQMLETPFEPAFSTFYTGSGGNGADSCSLDSSASATTASTADKEQGDEFIKKAPEWASRLICTCSS